MGTSRYNHQVNETDTLKREDITQSALVMSLTKNDQADRAISTSKLHASPHFHTWPIDVVVYYGSRRSLVLRLVSRLDAFSGYLFHT